MRRLPHLVTTAYSALPVILSFLHLEILTPLPTLLVLFQQTEQSQLVPHQSGSSLYLPNQYFQLNLLVVVLDVSCEYVLDLPLEPLPFLHDFDNLLGQKLLMLLLPLQNTQQKSQPVFSLLHLLKTLLPPYEGYRYNLRLYCLVDVEYAHILTEFLSFLQEICLPGGQEGRLSHQNAIIINPQSNL